MPSKAQIRGVIDEYRRAMTAKDRAAFMNLLAPDVVMIHEESWGRRTMTGLEDMAAFWDTVKTDTLWQTDPPMICGDEALVFLKAASGPPEARRETNRIVDRFGFNEAGKLSHIRVYYEH